jgi:YD repeat-containing protein
VWWFINQTDAKNQTSTTSYDKLGRMTQRVEPEGHRLHIAYNLSQQICKHWLSVQIHWLWLVH